MKLHISLVADSEAGIDNGSVSVPVMCAVCPELNEDMILTSALVNRLLHPKTDSSRGDHVTLTDCDVIADAVKCNGDSVGGSIVDDDDTQPAPEEFRAEQQCDDSLKHCWALASRGKGGYTVRDGLLYHEEKIECVGEKCVQLCLPAARRTAVLELAHCTIGCHQAYRRTRDRIRLSFYWPTLLADTRDYCSRCEVCQKTARITVWDRTPITSVHRAHYAFQQFLWIARVHYFQIRKRLPTTISLFCETLRLHFRSLIPCGRLALRISLRH